MRTNWTPGPWRAEKQTARTASVATCHWDGQPWWDVSALRWDTGSAEANAALIAAAPELYDALDAICRFAEKQGRDSGLYRDARAALAKARGD